MIVVESKKGVVNEKRRLKMPQFTSKVDLGHILTVITLLVSGMAGFANLKSQLDATTLAVARIEGQIAEDRRELKDLTVRQSIDNSWIEQHKKEDVVLKPSDIWGLKK